MFSTTILSSEAKPSATNSWWMVTASRRIKARRFSGHHFHTVSLDGFTIPSDRKSPRLKYQKWSGGFARSKTQHDAVSLARLPTGFYFGAKFGQKQGVWLTDPWGAKLVGAPISAKTREELLRSQTAASPKPEYRGDAFSRHLDTMTLEDHLMEKYGASRETVRTFFADEGGGYGLGPDALSGYTGAAFDALGAIPEDGEQMFPDGNSGIARLIVKSLLPDAIAGTESLEDVCRKTVNFAALDRPGSNT